MYGDSRDEEQGVFVPPPLTDDDSVDDEDPRLLLTVGTGADDPQSPTVTDSQHPTTPFAVPIWLREASASFRWRWIPLPLRKAAWAIVSWVKGPDPPLDLRFKPLFPAFQELPVRYLNHFFPKRRHKVVLLLSLYFTWFLSWFLLLLRSASVTSIEGYGKPTHISCASSFWASGNGCGLNGNNCRPFTSATFAFDCPANCKSTILLQPHTVGNESLYYQPLVVGGPDLESSTLGLYRADSFICQAAIHAGAISNAKGGCGVAKLEGPAHSYPSVRQNGLQSTSFSPTFPKSFSFVSLSPSEKAACNQNLQWTLLGITVAAIVLLSLFTTSPPIFFFSTFSILILHVALVSDPPNLPRLLDLFSLFFARLLPAAFIIYVLYLYCARPLLEPLSAPCYQLSRTILYLPFAFIGALNNYTFEQWIPIERLTPQDIQNEPGAKLALVVIITILLSIVLSQAWYIRLAGLMPRYLKIYGTMAATLVALLILPGLRLRIHHYILAMLFMPGTALPTRPSLVYQGLLLGLFVNGVAKWGFASIVETPAALGEQPRGTGGLNGWWGATSPNITNASVSIHLEDVPQVRLFRPSGNGNITFHLWEPTRMAKLGVDGVSVLVNDVEHWRGYLDEDDGQFTWSRQGRRGHILDWVGKRNILTLNHDNRQDQSGNRQYQQDQNGNRQDQNGNLQDQNGNRQDQNGNRQDQNGNRQDQNGNADGYGNENNDSNDDEDKDSDPEDTFFRFAFMRGGDAGMYGGVGVWGQDGSWIPPPPPKP